MMNFSRLSRGGRIPRFLESSQSRLFHNVSATVLPAPVDGQIAIPSEPHLPKRAQVVIAGAGMIGNSVAFHLTQVRTLDETKNIS